MRVVLRTTMLAALAMAVVWPLAADDGAIKPGTKAPDFTLTDTAGKTVKLSALKGKVVYLDFWATWCPPCRAALPHTQKISQRAEARRGDVVVLAVNVQEPRAEITKFMKDHKYTFRVPMDTNGGVSTKYGGDAIPTFAVVDKKGFVHWSTQGFGEGTADQIDKAIAAALKKK